MKVLVTQSCPTLCEAMDSNPPGSSVHGILRARIPEWVAIPFSRRSSQPRDQTQISSIADGSFTIWAISVCSFPNVILLSVNNTSWTYSLQPVYLFLQSPRLTKPWLAMKVAPFLTPFALALDCSMLVSQWDRWQWICLVLPLCSFKLSLLSTSTVNIKWGNDYKVLTILSEKD